MLITRFVRRALGLYVCHTDGVLHLLDGRVEPGG
jgi:hypothetical protein